MITPSQREERKKWIGSSDAAAILSVDPYKNAYDVWAEKVGKTEMDCPQSEASEIGTELEESIIRLFERKMSLEVARNLSITPDSYLHHGPGFAAANLDGIIETRDFESAIVEAKTAGMCGPLSPEWGDEWTDQIPDKYIIQVHHQMMVMGDDFSVAFVPAILGGAGFKIYKVQRNNDLIETIRKIEEEVWNEHVLKLTPPRDVSPSMDTIRRIRRDDVDVTQLDEDLVQQWLLSKEAKRMAEAQEEEKKIALLASFGSAEHGIFSKGMISYVKQKRKAYTVQETEYRTLRIKLNKALAA